MEKKERIAVSATLAQPGISQQPTGWINILFFFLMTGIHKPKKCPLECLFVV